MCLRCTGRGKSKDDPNYYLKANALPVWYKDGEAQYRIPPCLKGLSYAEKLLIQRVSPFVPLHHIKSGVFGLSGHVCAFEQEIEPFVKTLPREAKDVSMLRVLKTIKSEVCGEEENTIRAYRVRKAKVIEALWFLKQYNKEYKDIEIDESALDWIQGEEGVLEAKTIETEEILTRVDNDKTVDDVGPAPKQFEVVPGTDVVNEFGLVDTGDKAPLCEHDQAINDELMDATAKSPKKKDITVDWPAIHHNPVSEFGEKRIFVNAFPWLFPGGIGDVKDSPDSPAEWGRQLLYYEDGRFESDQIFGFFALNYIVRHRNSQQGSWFIDKFHKNGPETIEELQDQVKSGNTNFINSLNYWNQRVIGSAPYWFKKKNELHSWICHHVQEGNGPPTFFITLSCAESVWPDIIALVRERMEIAGDAYEECYVGSPQLYGHVNRYALVVQEYFQKRVITWLETVGKQVFRIKHYWIRYEFAPGRGQIHAHLLAIPDNHQIYEACHRDYKKGTQKSLGERAERFAKWAQENLGLTASVADPSGFDHLNINISNTPCRTRFSDVGDDIHSRRKDFDELMNHVQCHDCSGFCMKPVSGSKTYVLSSFPPFSASPIFAETIVCALILYLGKSACAKAALVRNKRKGNAIHLVSLCNPRR